MTALREYQRLEATALWRATSEDQRREVIVSIGDATLVITDLQDRPLTHWSLAAIHRQNAGNYPATYHPDGDPGETLELAEDETAMITAIERLRRAVDRTRPHPKRLRGLGVLALLAPLVSALALLWLPGAVLRHTVSVVPDIKRAEIGEALLTRIERVSGRSCSNPDADAALTRLAGRTGVDQLVVIPGGMQTSLHLPGGIIVVNVSVFEDTDDPAAAAGYIVAEKARATQRDALRDLLSHAGTAAPFRLLTTGEVSDSALDAYTETVLSAAPVPLPDAILLSAFAEASIPSTPYAFSVDPTGKTVLGLVEADPVAAQTPNRILRDRDWLLVQAICDD